MSVYSQVGFGTNLSAYVTAVEAQHEAMRSLERGTTEPPIMVHGMLWHRTDYPTLGNAILWRKPDDTWQFLIDPDHGQINAGGTVDFAANQSMDGFKLTDLGAPTTNGDAARYEDAYATAQGRQFFRTLATTPAAVVQTDAAPTTTFNSLGYVPRKVSLRLYGDVIKESDASVPGTIDQVIEYTRWDEDVGAGFAGTGGKTAVWSGTIGATAITVYIEPKYTTAYGFWISIENGSAERYTAEVVQFVAEAGIGQ